MNVKADNASANTSSKNVNLLSMNDFAFKTNLNRTRIKIPVTTMNFTKKVTLRMLYETDKNEDITENKI